MTNIFILLITGYQKLISPFFKQLFGIKSFCRYEKTCSEYAKESIKENGILQGGLLATKRVLSCNPISKSLTKAL